MTIGIAGPDRKAPGRSAVAGLIIIAIVAGIGLVLLGLVGDILVDWMWFSAIGYTQVFWTTIGAKAGVFAVIFAVTAVVLWANARIALRLAVRRSQVPAGFDPKLAGIALPPDPGPES
jgi:uncharacterized protein